MALNNDAVLTAAKGYIYVAPVGTANPSAAEIESFDAATGFVGWENLGHTSRDELPEFGFDGGDTETRGTWQNEALKTVVTDPAVDYVTFRLHQFDELGLSLYYGSDTSVTDGEMEINSTTGGNQYAILIVMVDGDLKLGWYAAKTDIRREESIDLSVDEFAALPLRATVNKPDNGPLMKWINLPEMGS